MHKTNNTKNIYALLVGFVLIFFAIFISLSPSLFQKKEKEAFISKEENPSFSEASSLLNQELQKMILSDNPLLVDIRSSSDFSSSHIINSLNIEPQSVIETLKQILEKENSSSLIIFIGYKEQVSQIIQIKNTFTSLFPNKTFFTLSEGFDLWKSESYPVINAGDPTNPTDQTKIEYINPSDAFTLIGSDNTLFILDVRETSSHAKDYIDISKNIPLTHLERKKDEIPRGSLLLVYGSTALESFQAGVRLFDMGFFRVLTLDGSYEDLIQQSSSQKEPTS
ncbi:MAG: hypothetical protein EOM19_01190 [Candidatus Moranbacteria bacterium]|nr:hypothetical protein [Candidatus Moranbacteria bacterium]